MIGDVLRQAGGAAEPEPDDVLSVLVAHRGTDRLVHVRHLPRRDAVTASWPEWVAPSVHAAVAGSGITALWSHQRRAADLAWAGTNVVLATGTASGKSLGYLLPVLTRIVEGRSAPSGRGASALYLAPTKALATDQAHHVQEWAIPGVRVATYDGDTPPEERRWARDHAHLVLSNPDLLHHSLLPGHAHWAPFLRRLRYVVIDECHIYRGVFGSHVAAVIRRLRRVAARYGSEPVFVLASATVGDPAQHASALVGVPVTAVETDGSPRGEMTFALWEPGPLSGSSSLDASGSSPARRSATSESADLLADLVGAGVQTVAFARSRAGVEVLAARARRVLGESWSDPGVIAAYRGGYLPEERRELEAGLRDRSIVGLAATNALELGVDISGLDAVVMAGWPGRRESLWQQAGRAGRTGQSSLAVFVAADDPLDTYVVHHPEVIFDTPVEATVMDPSNPYVLAPHLAAAAAELPLKEADLDAFGPHARAIVDSLVERSILRHRPAGWFWARDDRASDHVSLRGGSTVVTIAEKGSGRVVGTIDTESAPSQVHPGAVHVHQGQSYVVTELDLELGVATVVRGDPGWTTTARSTSSFRIETTERTESHGPVDVAFGTVCVTTQVTNFLRRLPGGEVIGVHQLDLPERTLTTKGVWWTVPGTLLGDAGVAEASIAGAAHAAEHGAIGLLPLLATCDRWDIGGVSTACHPDTGAPTVMIYDGYPGGAGFAERAFATWRDWLAATRAAIADCTCATGCPACVQSPKCGNGNEPLDKAGAVHFLDVSLGA